MTHYDVVERAISYLVDNYKEQPSLGVVARHVGLSQYHFQRLFQKWSGVSPKKFLQYVSIKQAKELLRQDCSLLETSFEVGLSGTSRLHDLFITIEGMTPGNFKKGAEKLKINYSFSETQFGKIIIASTEIGICYLAFCADEREGLSNLKLSFPKAVLKPAVDQLQQQAVKMFEGSEINLPKIKLYLKGTPFQLKVWATLLQLPPGSVCTYADIAKCINRPKSTRAVGAAVGSNPIAYLIPCHRVIRSTGIIGDYRWGKARKQAILGFEAAKYRSS